MLFLGLPPDKVELPHDMKNDNKSYKTNAHDKNNVRRNLEPRGVVCVKLQHFPEAPPAAPPPVVLFFLRLAAAAALPLGELLHFEPS